MLAALRGARICANKEKCVCPSSKVLAGLVSWMIFRVFYLFIYFLLDAVEAPVPLTVCTDVRALLSDSPQANDDK